MKLYRVIIVLVFLAALVYTSITNPEPPPKPVDIVQEVDASQYGQ